MDRQTRFQGDSIAAAVLAGDVPVRGAAAFDLLASLSLAAPAAPAGDLDLREAQGARAPARPETVKSQNAVITRACYESASFASLRKLCRNLSRKMPDPTKVETKISAPL